MHSIEKIDITETEGAGSHGYVENGSAAGLLCS